MAFDTAQFRLDFPEFSDTAKYTDPQVSFWGGIAEVMLPQDRWRELYTQGLSLFVAHNLVLAVQNKRSSSMGGAPGIFAGAKQSKTVGSASSSYDAAGSSVERGGPWNLTTYGKTLLTLQRMIGAGALQL